MKNYYRFTKPPKALRRPGIQLDNFALVPASLLMDMSDFQAIADRQPAGTAVMVLPSSTSSLRRVYAAIAQVRKVQGKATKLFTVR